MAARFVDDAQSGGLGQPSAQRQKITPGLLRRRWPVLVGLVIAASTFRCGSADAAGVPRFDVGVGTHIGLLRDSHGAVSDALAGLAANSFRDEILWSRVERTKGELTSPSEMAVIRELALTFARRNGGRPLLILAYGNANYDKGKAPHSNEAIEAFARYAAFIASSLRGAIDRFEVWNEWNRKARFDDSIHEAGSPEVYAQLVRATWAALKAVDPKIQVVVGAVEGVDLNWLDAFGRAGGFEYTDVVSLHPYAHHARSGPELSIRRVEQSRAVIERYAPGRAIPILLSELGWPITRNPSGVSEATGADYIVRVMLLARSRSWIQGVWWYNLIDSGRESLNDEHNFGLLTKDGRRKAGYDAFAAVARLLNDVAAVEEIPSPVSGVRMVRIVSLAGTCSTVVWSEQAHQATTHRLRSHDSRLIRVEWVHATPDLADGRRLPSTFDSVPISGRPIVLRDCGSVRIQPGP